MKFYSEYQEDVWIAKHLPLPRLGVYVDVGCAHPTISSNTAFLRDRGWKGLAIDGHVGWAPFWKGPNSHFYSAIISAKPVVRYYHDNQLSRITEDGVLKSARRLDDLLEQFGIGEIDYLSVDAEGSEFDILQTFDLLTVLPTIIVAEYKTQMPDGSIAEDQRVRDWLLGSGKYVLSHSTFANHVFFCP